MIVNISAEREWKGQLKLHEWNYVYDYVKMDQLMTLFLVLLTHTVTLILIMPFPEEKWIDR